MKTVVTIAAFNEERVIGRVLENIPAGLKVIVVDDGSTDRTREICLGHGAAVVTHPVNLGQGAAVLTGFKKALEGDYKYIVEMDGDGQHDPRDIEHFVKELESDKGLDVVVGSRVLGSAAKGPLIRRKLLPAVTWVINMLTEYQLTDSMSGFRAFRAESLRRCVSLVEDFQEPQYLAAEMFIKFSRSGLKVGEIPIHIDSRTVGVSYKGLVRYGWGISRAIVKTLLRADD